MDESIMARKAKEEVGWRRYRATKSAYEGKGRRVNMVGCVGFGSWPISGLT